MSDQQNPYPPYQDPQYQQQYQQPVYQEPPAPDGRPLAGLGQRLGARLLDGLFVILATAVVVGLIAAGVAALLSPFIDEDSPAISAVLITGAVLLVLGVQYVYEVEIPLRWNGQTPGKRIVKIAIIPLEPNLPLSRGKLAYRWVVTLGFSLLSNCYVGFIDPLWCLWDKPYRQCLHDKPPKTTVIQVVPVQAFGATESNPPYPTVR